MQNSSTFYSNIEKTDSFKSRKVIYYYKNKIHENSERETKYDFVMLSKSGKKRYRKNRISLTIPPDIVSSLAQKFNSLSSQSQFLDTKENLGLINKETSKFREDPQSKSWFKQENENIQRVENYNQITKDKINFFELKDKSTPSSNDLNLHLIVPSSSSFKAPENTVEKKTKIGNSLICSYDNKTDEEKVYERIETALSTSIYKELDSEDEAEENEDIKITERLANVGSKKEDSKDSIHMRQERTTTLSNNEEISQFLATNSKSIPIEISLQQNAENFFFVENYLYGKLHKYSNNRSALSLSSADCSKNEEGTNYVQDLKNFETPSSKLCILKSLHKNKSKTLPARNAKTLFNEPFSLENKRKSLNDILFSPNLCSAARTYRKVPLNPESVSKQKHFDKFENSERYLQSKNNNAIYGSKKFRCNSKSNKVCIENKNEEPFYEKWSITNIFSNTILKNNRKKRKQCYGNSKKKLKKSPKANEKLMNDKTKETKDANAVTYKEKSINKMIKGIKPLDENNISPDLQSVKNSQKKVMKGSDIHSSSEILKKSTRQPLRETNVLQIVEKSQDLKTPKAVKSSTLLSNAKTFQNCNEAKLSKSPFEENYWAITSEANTNRNADNEVLQERKPNSSFLWNRSAELLKKAEAVKLSKFQSSNSIESNASIGPFGLENSAAHQISASVNIPSTVNSSNNSLTSSDSNESKNTKRRFTSNKKTKVKSTFYVDFMPENVSENYYDCSNKVHAFIKDNKNCTKIKSNSAIDGYEEITPPPVPLLFSKNNSTTNKEDSSEFYASLLYCSIDGEKIYNKSLSSHSYERIDVAKLEEMNDSRMQEEILKRKCDAEAETNSFCSDNQTESRNSEAAEIKTASSTFNLETTRKDSSIPLMRFEINKDKAMSRNASKFSRLKKKMPRKTVSSSEAYVPPCPPRHLKQSSLSSSSFSSSVSSSSTGSFGSLHSASSLTPPNFVLGKNSPLAQKSDTFRNQDDVYVTSSSTIIFVSGDDSNLYDSSPYDSTTYWNATSSVASSSECQMRSIFYEDVNNECQEISCFVEGNEAADDLSSHHEAIYEVIDPEEEENWDEGKKSVVNGEDSVTNGDACATNADITDKCVGHRKKSLPNENDCEECAIDEQSGDNCQSCGKTYDSNIKTSVENEHRDSEKGTFGRDNERLGNLKKTLDSNTDSEFVEILPADDDCESKTSDFDSESSFDSFDSDDAYSRLSTAMASNQKTLSLHRDHKLSETPNTGVKNLRKKYLRSNSHTQQSYTKFAEVANLSMKRIRRNFSEVKTGLKKIKKKTLTLSDSKGTEDILKQLDIGALANKPRWSIASHFKKKSIYGDSSPDLTNSTKVTKNGETDEIVTDSTFYLATPLFSADKNDSSMYAENYNETESNRNTWNRKDETEGNTCEWDGNMFRVSSDESRTYTGLSYDFKSLDISIHEKSEAQISTNPSPNSATKNRRNPKILRRPLSASNVSLSRGSSSASSNSSLVIRPSEPPPVPPKSTELLNHLKNEESVSRDMLALRLNHLLKTGPVPLPGRRTLKTGDNHQNKEEEPVSLPEISHRKNSLPGAVSLLQLYSEKEHCPTSIPSKTPKTRHSIARLSNAYSKSIKLVEISDTPPPLPARPDFSNYRKKRCGPAVKLPKSGSQSSINTSSPEKSPIKSPLELELSYESISINNNKLNSCNKNLSKIFSKSYLELPKENGSSDSIFASSQFADEPLYQFYTAKVEREALINGEDDYEVINPESNSIVESIRPTAMELIAPFDGRRTLWCEIPEVVQSGILDKITDQEKKVQEAMFEVLTSEASYIKSLDVLISHFMNCDEFIRENDPVISKRDRNILFSDVIAVKYCSELLLADLEKRWQESFLISGSADVLHKHASTSFSVYVKYCSNQIYQDRKLRDLKENSRFMEVLNRLESSPVCQLLSMQSFLMLPMQRVTRLPLLIDAIFNRLKYNSNEWHQCKMALASVQKIVKECNEGARKMERMEEMLLLSQQLDFRDVKATPLISASRWLVKRGELTRLTWKETDGKLTFGRRISKHSIYLFLFNDSLVVAKKKSEEQYTVFDYCPRNMVQVLELDNADRANRALEGCKNLMIMTVLQNQDNKTVEMVLSCSSESERSRWVEAVTPKTSENPDERIYEEWDCPQVQVVHNYVSKQADELSLEISEVLNVFKKTSDGWYHGEKLRNCSRGWFPGNHTVEIASAHIRAQNLRQRYRLLAISGSILDGIKKKEKADKRDKENNTLKHVKTKKKDGKKDRRKTVATITE